jgi:cytoskeleton protein RodZ
MEGLGTKLREARLARGLTLDDAYRMTKIRPNRLEAIENEDFSLFDSLTYSKAAVLIYGKFLEVDVSPYLEAFETSESVTVDGYAYLQDAPDPEPARPVTVRRRSSSPGSGGGGGGRSSFVPLIIGVVVLVVGFTVMKWFLQMQRLNPRPTPAPGTSPVATATVTDRIIAPHAQPADNTTAPAATTSALPTATATAAPAVTPVVPAPAAVDPEVRRAEPVNPKDAAVIPTPTPSPKRSPKPPRPTPASSPRSTVITTPRPR